MNKLIVHNNWITDIDNQHWELSTKTKVTDVRQKGK